MATSKGEIHDVFFDNIHQLAEQADTAQRSLRGEAPRDWNLPEKVDNPLDVPGITAAFERTAIDSNYEQVISDGKNPGTVGDVVSLKAQGDYIGVMERAFRARHATPVRCLAHAAARRKGHAHPRGVLLGGVVGYAQDALTAGQG